MKKIIALSALMAALASASAMAVDANITFTGAVKAGTCTMNTNDATKTLVIPDIGAVALAQSNTNWATQNVGTTISFSKCPNSVTSINIAKLTTTGGPGFSGSTSTPASGTAGGLVLGIQAGESPGWLNLTGWAINRPFAVTDGSVTIPIKAAVGRYSASQPVTPGNYSSSFTMTFSWS
ncbi:hypothetical protein SJ554_19835 [Enterobacter asburiae]|uniref:fimbrial protein n=1 Tax=Enterobacter asburiae TaxID=61645 RepID=UPI0029D7C8D6|nr:hypothetical protein [Enterobacter asburiae]MDX7664704.1 hypothetical protein [Enterobacter asburiae]